MDKTENPFLATLRLPVKNSPIMLTVVIAAHIVCLILPWLTGLGLYIKMILMCLAVISLCVYLYKHGLYRDKQRVEMLVLDAEDNWQLKMSDGAVHHVELGHSLFVHPWLTIISIVFEKRQRYFIFTPETLNSDQFRRLRVRLRFKVGK